MISTGKIVLLASLVGIGASLLIRWVRASRELRDAERQFLEQHQGRRWSYRPGLDAPYDYEQAIKAKRRSESRRPRRAAQRGR